MTRKLRWMTCCDTLGRYWLGKEKRFLRTRRLRHEMLEGRTQISASILGVMGAA